MAVSSACLRLNSITSRVAPRGAYIGESSGELSLLSICTWTASFTSTALRLRLFSSPYLPVPGGIFRWPPYTQCVNSASPPFPNLCVAACHSLRKAASDLKWCTYTIQISTSEVNYGIGVVYWFPWCRLSHTDPFICVVSHIPTLPVYYRSFSCNSTDRRL